MYTFPHTAQLSASLAKWQLQSTQSVVVLMGLTQCQQSDTSADHALTQHLHQVLKKAKALQIPVIQIEEAQLVDGLMRLGQAVSPNTQLILMGHVSVLFQQILQHALSMTAQVCIVNDAVLCEHQVQHIQWMDRMVRQQVHHMNSATLLRLWSLSAPKEQILSSQGIIFAIAEQLDLEPFDLHPEVDLRQYGLDSVGMVKLIALWRANGANINYEQFLQYCCLRDVLRLLQPEV